MRESATPLRFRRRSELERALERLFDGSLDQPSTSKLARVPRVELAEARDEIRVTARLAGLDPGDVQVDVRRNSLTIAGRWGPRRPERGLGSFRYTLRLPSEVDPDPVGTRRENGVLTIELKKAATTKPRRACLE